MSLNDTPSGERIHIGFFGIRNAGKSSVVNAVAGQKVSIVSEQKGTTTDPVYKAMELLPLGPVMLIDTPGFDDEGELGKLRVEQTKKVLSKTDIAVLVVDANKGLQQTDRELISLFEENNIKYIIVYNKSDLLAVEEKVQEYNTQEDKLDTVCTSTITNFGIHELKEKIAHLVTAEDSTLKIVGGLVEKGDVVVLVIPIDSAAPKGRLILPQQQVLRDLLDTGVTSLVVRESELEESLKFLHKKPKLVITDSQVFGYVSGIVPTDIKLTSFSILMARYKGFLETAVKGANVIDRLKDNDKVLISEGCTHHRQCDDIGTVKIPRWLKEYTGKDIVIETTSGREFPDDLSEYALVIHCGGCMLNKREIISRMKRSKGQKVAFTNYGIAIAKMKGILDRAIEIFDFDM